ncbi:exported protein of unknown function [Streptomyces ambofaciens ATCC 23877]|uniref:Uncharacterized protein n=1 Tax=Streptomyces ambofaciens (strain ATCC 23877 / 3486 / DSM 40053 / JCM 4204 / NBRC 12836 / NRRL B-2516) TaxID=278992 RepID=A0A0K2B246_STRA7|nr:hypothetical protein [Streptomyces ambofaciens]AKZ59216.1 exported protein of unknown function [Streptomyces ambofaciens ATCC 23877]WNA15410.1 hypothetical protein SAMYPH_79 [Streptomyces phage Samy]
MSFAEALPWVLLALVLCVLVVVAGGIIGLRIALRGTSEDARPHIIRALGDYFRSLVDAVFRWRRK